VLSRSVRTADVLLAEIDRLGIPVHRTWRLNERQYGALAGRNKTEVRQEAGAQLYHMWRRSVTGRPGPLDPERLGRLRADPRYSSLAGGGLPAVESQADVIARVLPYWTDVITAQLYAGRTVLVVAHGNSLRALAGILDRLSDAEIEQLNIPTGAPLRYDIDAEFRPLVRGGCYLEPQRAREAAEAVAAEGSERPGQQLRASAADEPYQRPSSSSA
jgi:2,3-bisphosphoglycerate-dependent phosphoglycerate mutase